MAPIGGRRLMPVLIVAAVVAIASLHLTFSSSIASSSTAILIAARAAAADGTSSMLRYADTSMLSLDTEVELPAGEEAIGAFAAATEPRPPPSPPPPPPPRSHERAPLPVSDARVPQHALRGRNAEAPLQSAAAATAVAEARRGKIPAEGTLLHGNAGSELAVKESATVRRLLRLDGISDWQPPPGSLPAQLPPGAALDELLAAVPVGGCAWLAFGSAGVEEMLLNWCHHVIALGLGRRMLVAAFDDAVMTAMRRLRIPVYNYTGALPPVHFRRAPYLFHRMGFLKAELIRQVLSIGRQVLVSDSDVVWRKDPTPLLGRLAAAGAAVAASTDCIDVAADEAKLPPRASTSFGCGHSPGNAHGAIFNTGVLWFAPTAEAMAFARRWAVSTLALTDPWSDDQGVFNRLLTRGLYPVRALALGGALIAAAGGNLSVAPLPARHFCSGHLVWVQQASEPRDCFSVHATFTEFGDAGKRWRLIESGLWGVLPDAYFTRGRFLTFTPPHPPPDPAPCGRVGVGCGEDAGHGLPPKRAGNILSAEGLKRSARLRANVELMGRQVHALRDAMAMARVLNRTLVLPHFGCLCDRSELTEVMPSCVYPGAPAVMAVPFKCSTHFVLDSHKLQMLLEPTAFGMRPEKFGGAVTPPLPLRANSFLSDPRTSNEIRRSIVKVAVIDAGAEVGDGDGSLRTPQPPAPRIRKGLNNEELVASLAPHAEARVLALSTAEGVFGGWVSRWEEAFLFRTMMEYFVLGGSWCCTSRVQDEGRVLTRNPPPLRMPPKGVP